MYKNKRLQVRVSQELIEHCKNNSQNISLFVREAVREKLEANKPVDTDTQFVEIRARTPYIFFAQLLEIVDGDTLYIEADLGFFTTIKTKIRLANINTPEISTPEGIKAKKFVEKELQGAHLLIETRKKEKFGRYLALVYYDQNNKDFEDIIRNGKLLNDELVKNGLAEIYQQ